MSFGQKNVMLSEDVFHPQSKQDNTRGHNGFVVMAQTNKLEFPLLYKWTCIFFLAVALYSLFTFKAMERLGYSPVNPQHT